ncbi:uncharacterized protein HMPREF1541_10680 [Cyphellophora europaea CBS 101466]|uniref:Zn(2)-C6 fungal-type domain-containing protein n=1 Tax=Cyphellophora europaea (strain CBS 101466) TaxID=1220924 RepID=W2S679_CYPE1|nr:uncharacterized protein HMPREF1541_10680 [Cyphellophora europaea CBS 101466]ETN44130.1 hypothetical protein HMPREF1541_10680 [Cyphellophora europaea CBS 101466]
MEVLHTRRPARSKDGCLTCKRRKVRCNEQKPRCSHCERLNLECNWPLSRQRAPLRVAPQTDVTTSNSQQPYPANIEPNAFEGFDFANLLSEGPTDSAFANYIWLDHDAGYGPPNVSTEGSNITAIPQWQQSSPSAVSTGPTENHLLVESFFNMKVPPILEPIETGPKWLSTRSLFETMSAESYMVRLAIMSFSAVQYQVSGADPHMDHRSFYDKATKELSRTLVECGKDVQLISQQLKHILATIFLLTYADLVTEREDIAHSNLKEAHLVIHRADKTKLGSLEKKLISWVRLLDARAVSAGGEGLFLADKVDTANPTPNRGSPVSILGSREAIDAEVEEVLFDILYQPGIEFFQKVQSFVGRITMIDRWHRGRDTVEDETEVMAIAATITKDLSLLYNQRPALMDYAVAGHITDKFLSPNLVLPVTRSFQTYLANFHACYIHLHRVAYKHLPRSNNVSTACSVIKALAHQMVISGNALPVNLLWPMMMWGCEEDDVRERQWIVETIQSMVHNATNAKRIAELLVEVQRQQDTGGIRVDVREVSHQMFQQAFAIV